MMKLIIVSADSEFKARERKGMQMDREISEKERQHWHDRIGAEKALSWHGFGSPVGLGILAISIGLTAVLLRVALVGFQ